MLSQNDKRMQKPARRLAGDCHEIASGIEQPEERDRHPFLPLARQGLRTHAEKIAVSLFTVRRPQILTLPRPTDPAGVSETAVHCGSIRPIGTSRSAARK